MILTEDKLIDYVEYKNGLLFTRKTVNLTHTNISQAPQNTLVCISGYDHILHSFFTSIIHLFKNKFILLIIETDIVRMEPSWLDHKNLRYCYTWNKPFHHHKLYCLPIGLNYKRQYEGMNHWLLSNKMTDFGITKMMCINCDPQTNSDRAVYINKAKNEWSGFCDILESVPPLSSNMAPSHIDYNGEIKITVTNPVCYNQWKQYKFILSPPGTGFDCHRTWEAVSIGIIPIVLSSTLNELYEDLPILVVDNYDILSEEFLKNKYIIIKNGKYDMDKITLDYWIHKINLVFEF